MARQYLRVCSLTVAGRTIELLRMTFNIEKDILGVPNRGKIQIYNLSADSRTAIQKSGIRIVLKAGYQGDVGTLFIGNVLNVFHIRKEADIITEIYAADGFSAYKDSYFSQTISPGISPKETLKKVASSFQGIEIGTIEGVPDKSSSIYGQTLSGSTEYLMNKQAKEYNVSWSIQDEVLQVFPLSGSLQNTTRILSATTGMIGSPTITEIGSNSKVLMDRTIVPGTKFRIDSTTPIVKMGNYYFQGVKPTIGKGIYRANKVTHKGDTHADLWETEIEGFVII